MPPRRRKRFSNPRSRPRVPSSSAAAQDPVPDQQSSSPPPADGDIEDGDDYLAPPFFNTTFSTHRVSPLYIGSEPLSPARLQILSHRLRDTLVGDVVRGVEVGMEGTDDGAMGRAGALEQVAIHRVALESILGRDGAVGDGPRPVSRDLSSDAVTADHRRLSRTHEKALCISLQYENTLCTALLLPSLSAPERETGSNDEDNTTAQPAGQTPQPTLFGSISSSSSSSSSSKPTAAFLSLPLLLLRMPSPLKAIITDFLSNTFDCRVAPLSLGTRSLVRSWERWAADTGLPTRGPLAKDAVLTLGFHGPSILQGGAVAAVVEDDKDDERSPEDGGPGEGGARLGIKTIDVIIPAEDLRRFAEAGNTFEEDPATAAAGGIGERSGGTISPYKRRPATSSIHSPDDDDDSQKKRRKLAGCKDEEGWSWRPSTTDSDAGSKDTSSLSTKDAFSQPFTEALAHYLDRHLALDLFHPAVRVSRVACGGFVVSEGRVKVFAPPGSGADDEPPGDGLTDTQRKAVWGLVEGLTGRAKGRRLA